MNYKTKKTQVLSYNLLKREDKKMLAYWAYYKSLYSNSIIIGTPRAIAKEGRTGYSPNTIAKHLAYFMENGLAKKENGRYILTPKEDLALEVTIPSKAKKDNDIYKRVTKSKRNRYFTKIPLGTVKEMYSSIAAYKLVNLYKQVNHERNVYRKDKTPSANSIQCASPITLSNRGFAKIMNVSPSTAQRIIFFQDGKSIRKYNFKLKKICAAHSRGMYEGMKSKFQGVFCHKGVIYQKLPSVFLPIDVYTHKAMIDYMATISNANQTLVLVTKN
jgi:hypothetical protein